MNAMDTVISNTILGGQGLFSIAVVLACFVVGYVLKHYTKVPNRYIPLIMIGLGIILNVLLNIPVKNIDPETGEEIQAEITIVTILIGAISGLASSGLYEMLSKSLGLNKDDEDKDGESESRS